ncbi:hypothetical protein B0H19DRAFT_1084208 [Mycena capillaripes]|nr:hypothetical protein B0H19DRAFT_1084208 [Mycena capillaripes]
MCDSISWVQRDNTGGRLETGGGKREAGGRKQEAGGRKQEKQETGRIGKGGGQGRGRRRDRHQHRKHARDGKRRDRMGRDLMMVLGMCHGTAPVVQVFSEEVAEGISGG